MKLTDLFEKEKTITKNVYISSDTEKLIYRNTIVDGNFDCSSTRIKSLVGSPKHVTGNFNCGITGIKSLKGSPNRVDGTFNCNHTIVTSLEGGPEYVGGDFSSHNTKIVTLHNIHKHIKHIGGTFFLPNSLEGYVLGVMFIKDLKRIVFITGTLDQKQLEAIINKHLSSDRNVHDAQQELIEAGLSEYAKL